MTILAREVRIEIRAREYMYYKIPVVCALRI